MIPDLAVSYLNAPGECAEMVAAIAAADFDAVLENLWTMVGVIARWPELSSMAAARSASTCA